MTETIKNAIEIMTRLNPYSRSESSDEERYDSIYEALHTLGLAGVISKREWFIIVDVDRRLAGGVKDW